MKKKLISLSLLLIGAISLCGCYNSTSYKEGRKTQSIMEEALNRVGMPNCSNMTERKQAKKILELRDDASLICYAYTRNEMTGKYVFITKCMGFGIPYSVQYTATESMQYASGAGHFMAPQPEPNGLYTPEGMSATWIISINDKGEEEPMYVEPEIIVTQHKLPKRLVESYSIEGLDYDNM